MVHSIDMKDGLDLIAECIITHFLPLLHIEILQSHFDLIYNFIARSLVNGSSFFISLYSLESTYAKFIEANAVSGLLQHIQSLQEDGKKYDTVVIPFMDSLSAISRDFENELICRYTFFFNYGY